MPTETTPTAQPPAPPTGPEIRLGTKPRSGDRSEMPSSLVSAINAEATKNGAGASDLAAPPQDPPQPPKAAPEPKAAQPEPPKPPTAKVDPPKTEPKSSKEENLARMREKLEKMEADATALQNSFTATNREKAEALTKLAEYEARVGKLAEEIDKTYKPQVERLRLAEQELEKQREVLRMKDYTATEEFHEKFVKPIADADAELNALLNESIVVVDGVQVPASREHFDAILNTKNLNAAGDLAEQLFGKHVGPQMVNLRARMKSLHMRHADAVKNAGVKAAEYEQQRQVQFAQQRELVHSTLLSEANRLIAETPELQVADEDEELKSAIHNATQFANKLIEGDPSWTPEQMAKNVAKARVKILKSDALEVRYKRLEAKHQEVLERLKQYESSEPNLAPRGGGGPPKSSAPGSAEETRAKLLNAFQAAAASPTNR